MHRIDRARHAARLPRAEGGSLLLFHDTFLGGEKDLWVAEADASGNVAPPWFVGGSCEGVPRGRLDGDLLEVECGEDRERPLQLRVSELSADSDGDGLTDRVEARLRTDPRRSDTDRDGLADATDPAPGGGSEPRTEEDEIALAVFRQLHMFDEGGETEAAVVIGEAALEWSGRRGPTITLTTKARDALVEEAGLDGIPYLSIAPGRQRLGREDDEIEETPASPDERYYQVTSYRGSLNAVGYDVTVRRLGPSWVVTSCRVAWVS